MEDDEDEEDLEFDDDDDDDEEDDDEMEIDSDSEEEESAPIKQPVRSGSGKSLRSGGKVLRKPMEDDDEDDEDDFVPAKRPTRSSAAKKPEADDMEESEDESSSDEEVEMDDVGLGPQSLVKDEEDQKYLDSLPEIDREAILGERFEKRKADADMKKALREAKYVTAFLLFVLNAILRVYFD